MEEDFDIFLESFGLNRVIETLEISEPQLAELMRTYLLEARVGCRLLEGLDPVSSPRILEVGSGIGLLSLFAASRGFQVVSIEPEGSGFGFMHRMRKLLLESAPALGYHKFVEFKSLGVEELNPEIDGRFDFIFSSNVLEHVDSVEKALDSAASVMNPGSTQEHICPNYLVPYEPHFGIALLPFLPRAARVLLRKEDRDSEIWNSLNFVTSLRIAKWARRKGHAITFSRTELPLAFSRLATDPVFTARHKMLGRVFRPPILGKLISFATCVPGQFQSPMRFSISKA